MIMEQTIFSNKRIFSDTQIADNENDYYPSIVAFENFMLDTTCSEDEKFSHLSTSKDLFYIAENNYSTFLELLSNASRFKKFNIMEYPSNIFPAVFVFDLTSSVIQPIASKVISTLYGHMKSLLKMDILENYDQCILVQEKDNNTRFFVLFPYVVIFRKLFLLIRQLVLKDKSFVDFIQDIYSTSNMETIFSQEIIFPIMSNSELFDVSVYNGLGEEINNSRFFKNSDRLTTMQLLSVRSSKFSEMVPLSILGDVSLKFNQNDLYCSNFVSKLVDLIDPKKVNITDIACALLNLQLDDDENKDLFPIMQKFASSFQSIQWKFMKMNPCPTKNKMGLSTLIYFASVHSGNSFQRLLYEHIWIFVKYICDKYVSIYQEENKKEEQPTLRAKFNTFDAICYYMASIAKMVYGHIFVCSNISRKYWFYFNGVTWIKSNRAVHLSKLIESDFHSLFSFWSIKFLEEDVSNNLFFVKQTYSKCCSDFACFLRTPLKKKMLIDVCAEHFYWDFHHVLNKSIKSVNFDEILDTNVSLIGLQNGVYDLSVHMFRSSKPDDFVFLSTKNNFFEFSWDHHLVLEILEFLRSVFPNQNIRQYVLKLFASFIDGNIEEQFYIFTGTGSNGKSKLVELFQLSMGDYVATLPVSLITGKRTPSSSATPELARMKGKRLGVLHESNVTDTINLGLIKAISGGDNMYARALHSEPIEFRPTFQLLLLCNDKPKRIDPYDFATWRRIIVVTFSSSFLDNPDPNNSLHFQKDTNLHTKLPLWKEAFFWILTQYYEEFCNNGNPIPDEIIFDTQTYRETNDYIGNFINSEIERTNYLNDIIYIDDVFCRFKNFYSHHYQEQSKMKFDEFKDIIVSKIGPLITINHKKKGWTNFIYVKI